MVFVWCCLCDYYIKFDLVLQYEENHKIGEVWIMTKWLVAKTVNVYEGKKEYQIQERPLLHACCNQDHFGDVNIDFRPEVNPDFVCDVTKPLPFTKEQFKAGFMDTPWVNSWKWNLGKAIKEMLKVCEVVYVICPWVYGWRGCTPEIVEVSWRPGINSPILFVKYTKTEKFWTEISKLTSTDGGKS